MNAELRIHFSDSERANIADAMDIAGKIGTMTPIEARTHLGLKPWDTNNIGRIFRFQPEDHGAAIVCKSAGFSKDILAASNLLLQHLEDHLKRRMETPRRFHHEDKICPEFIKKTQGQIQKVSSVRHLLNNAMTAFMMLED